MFFIVFSFAV